jgi:hypothetical protein
VWSRSASMQVRLAQAGWNADAIAIEMRRITAASICRSTIDRHILSAKSMGLEIPALEGTATTNRLNHR